MLGLINIKNRQWAIFKTCAKSGSGLDDAFKWYKILMNINVKYYFIN